MRIFLIDDDDIFNYLHQSVVRSVLPDAEIDIYKSGEELICKLEENTASFIPPDYIFLDIRMPDMDGFTLLEKIESTYPNMFSSAKIYMLSSTLDERDLHRAKSFKSVNDFIGKPLSLEWCEKYLASGQ